MKKALELASVCEHPSAVWLTEVFGGFEVNTKEEARQVFLGKNDPRALCFAAVLVRDFDEIRRVADLGDAFAQVERAWLTSGQERFRWSEKSAGQGERDGFFYFGYCHRYGVGCQEDAEIATANYVVAAELGHVRAMGCLGELLDKDDPQRFFWLGRAAANGESDSFLNGMSIEMRNFNSGTGYAKVVFVIGRALKGHINNEKQAIFGRDNNFDTYIGLAKQALYFYEFQLQSYRKAVDSWTFAGLRNNVVKDIRKMIGKMIWDAREEAAYLEKK
jgi:hypothetical protein